jgi:hypothetical protein
MVVVAEGGGTDDVAVREETPLPTPTRRIARRLTALGLAVGLAAAGAALTWRFHAKSGALIAAGAR